MVCSSYIYTNGTTAPAKQLFASDVGKAGDFIEHSNLESECLTTALIFSNQAVLMSVQLHARYVRPTDKIILRRCTADNAIHDIPADRNLL